MVRAVVTFDSPTGSEMSIAPFTRNCPADWPLSVTTTVPGLVPAETRIALAPGRVAIISAWLPGFFGSGCKAAWAIVTVNVVEAMGRAHRY